MDNKEDVLFTKKMRIVTREIHGVSDALINAKIGFGRKCKVICLRENERNTYTFV